MAKAHYHRGMLLAVIPLLVCGLMFTALCAMMVGDFGRYDWYRWPDYVATGCFVALAGIIAAVAYVGALFCLYGGLKRCTYSDADCQEITGYANGSTDQGAGE